MRDRTWVGTGGQKHKGTEMIGTLWDRGLDQSLGAGRAQTRKAVLGEVEHWCLQHDDGADILAEFHSLATPDRRRRLTLGAAVSRRRAASVGRLSSGSGGQRTDGSGAVLTSSTRPSGPSIDRVRAGARTRTSRPATDHAGAPAPSARACRPAAWWPAGRR